MSMYNKNFNKLVVGFCGAPFAIGVFTGIVHHEPFFAAFGSGAAFMGTFIVELIGDYADHSDAKASRKDRINSKD